MGGMDVASWVSSGVAAAAVFVAWLMLRTAKKSESHAARSADAAERSERHAERSERHAERSADAAERSADAAARSADAAARSADAEERLAATAERDSDRDSRVSWGWKHLSGAVHELKNEGEQPAYNVEVLHPGIREQGNLVALGTIRGKEPKHVRVIRALQTLSIDVEVTFSREQDGPRETWHTRL
jgi:hypothetical protein